MQDWLALQSPAPLHTGAASPGVMQKPPWQTVAPPSHAQQSSLLAHAVRQAPSTHIWPATLQSPLAMQLGWGV